MSRICWNCRYFDHDDSLGTYSGKCRRHAPRAVDANGLANDYTRNSHRVQMGRVDEGIMTSVDSPVALYITQGVQVLPTSGGAGLAGDNCFPFTIGGGHRLAKVHVSSILMNTGAASVGANPVFKVGLYVIGETTDTLMHTVEIPIPAAQVGIAGNLTNNFIQLDYTLPTPWPDPPSDVGRLWAARFILESGDPNIIGEIDNTMIAGEIDYYGMEPYAPAAFPWMIEGNVQRCGQFLMNSGTIPALP